MRRALLLAHVIGCGACAGTNPRWDGPSEESGTEDDATGDPEVTGASSPGSASASTTTPSSDDDGPSNGDSETGGVPPDDPPSETTTAESTGIPDDPTTSSEPTCPEDRTWCEDDGECKKIDDHHCGPECVDCEVLWGSGARCVDGMCEPESDDDDD